MDDHKRPARMPPKLAAISGLNVLRCALQRERIKTRGHLERLHDTEAEYERQLAALPPEFHEEATSDMELVARAYRAAKIIYSGAFAGDPAWFVALAAYRKAHPELSDDVARKHVIRLIHAASVEYSQWLYGVGPKRKISVYVP